MSLYKIFEEGLSDAKKNSPKILTCLAGLGIAATSVVSIFAGKKLQKKDEEIEKKFEEKKAAGKEVTTKEVIKTHIKEKLPVLVPVAICVGVTEFCSFKAYTESAKQIAGLTIALTTTNQAFDSYKKATKKLLGEKEEEIQRERMKQDILDNPPDKKAEQKFLETKQQQIENNIYNGIEEWFEPLTKATIYITNADIVRAFECINYRLKNKDEDFIPFSDFLYELSKYSQNDISQYMYEPAAQEAGWSYENWKHGGIVYNVDGKKGVRVNGRLISKIMYKANWMVSGNIIDTFEY